MIYGNLLTTITVVIGCFVSYVAYQQYRLGKVRFRLDLFEKRFAVYKGTQVFLSQILTKGETSLPELFDFRAATQDAVFLFKSEVPDFIKEIDERALRMMTIRDELEELPVGEKRSLAVQHKSELLEWLNNKLPELKEIFGPYLYVGSWK
jgi:hypothetical protein